MKIKIYRWLNISYYLFAYTLKNSFFIQKCCIIRGKTMGKISPEGTLPVWRASSVT